jgi:hypothetical protein
MKCHNCPKNAMFWVGDDTGQVPLCLDCWTRYENAVLRQQEEMERQINYLSDEMDALVGLSPTSPRYPARRPIVHVEGVTLNNIKVSGSQIGVLNTGSIETVDATVNVLRAEGQAELAAALTRLTEEVIKANTIHDNQKNQVIELLGALSEEAAAPAVKRRLSVVKAMLGDLADALGGVAEIAVAWEAAKELLTRVFGV